MVQFLGSPQVGGLWSLQLPRLRCTHLGLQVVFFVLVCEVGKSLLEEIVHIEVSGTLDRGERLSIQLLRAFFHFVILVAQHSLRADHDLLLLVFGHLLDGLFETEKRLDRLWSYLGCYFFLLAAIAVLFSHGGRRARRFI